MKNVKNVYARYFKINETRLYQWTPCYQQQSLVNSMVLFSYKFCVLWVTLLVMQGFQAGHALKIYTLSI